MPRPKTVADDAVLDAALRVIDRGGPNELTLAAVAREVGLAPATLLQRFQSKRGLLLAINSRGSDNAGSSLREATKRHRSPLRALLAGLVDISSRVASPETLANHLAFLQIDLSDPEFHQLALAYTTAVREEIKRLLDAAVGAARSRRPIPHGSRRASRRPTTVRGSPGPSTARAGLTPGCGANSTRCSRPTEPHDPPCGRANSLKGRVWGTKLESRGSRPSRPQGTPSRAWQMTAQNASPRHSPP
jgi:AcrR family transcriptional regulator